MVKCRQIRFFENISITLGPSLKLVPQSVLISFETPVHKIKCREPFKDTKKISVTSKCMALIVKQLYERMYIFSIYFRIFLNKMVP